MPRPFIKMHGLGNDFVIIDGRADDFTPDEAFCLKVADRHRGVGYDQLFVLGKPKDPAADLFMHIYNCDGSPAGACGNGTRCVTSLLFKETGKTEGVIETVAGLLKVWLVREGIYAVDFGEPRLKWDEMPLARPMDTLSIDLGEPDVPPACCVNVGNPHAVHFVEDAETIALEQIGPKLEHHPLFPDRCNIEFAHIIDPTHIRMRVWERGTGITQACGSAGIATVIAAVRRNLSKRKVCLQMDGGDLEIEWREDNNHVILAGPVATSFTGFLDDSLCG